jgi:hypothetical protein
MASLYHSSENALEAASFARSQVGKPHDDYGIYRAVFWPKKVDYKSYYCVNFVACVLQRAGMLHGVNPNILLPDDLYKFLIHHPDRTTSVNPYLLHTGKHKADKVIKIINPNMKNIGSVSNDRINTTVMVNMMKSNINTITSSPSSHGQRGHMPQIITGLPPPMKKKTSYRLGKNAHGGLWGVSGTTISPSSHNHQHHPRH